MNCKRAQGEIALAVGGDLDDAAERDLRNHLADCPCCQRHWQQMHDTWSLLLERDDELPDPHDSVWPELAVRLPARRELLSRARFNGWVVAGAVAGVCLAMVSMWRTAHTPEPSLGPASEFAGTLSEPLPEFPRGGAFPAFPEGIRDLGAMPVRDPNRSMLPGSPELIPLRLRNSLRSEPSRNRDARMPVIVFPRQESP